ncbi:MAG: hypothetical protein KJP02_02345 [Octadecabacter sp.]|nr:hypothetical protein [Octadecabacter sp.]
MTRFPRPSGHQLTNGKLRIIATTDSHAAVLPYDFYVDRPAQGVGLLNLRETIAMLRETDATTLLVDNGDFLQGTPMSDVIAMDPAWRDSHMNPIVEAMNSVGYDAVGAIMNSTSGWMCLRRSSSSLTARRSARTL